MHKKIYKGKEKNGTLTRKFTVAPLTDDQMVPSKGSRENNFFKPVRELSVTFAALNRRHEEKIANTE